jgi:hypothetical protein
MQIDPSKTYELHRPKELSTMSLEAIQSLLSKEQFGEWLKAREAAGTAGPMMIGGKVSRMPGEAVNEMFTMGLKGGATPCYVDEETGQVFLGHYIFVPAPEGD